MQFVNYRIKEARFKKGRAKLTSIAHDWGSQLFDYQSNINSLLPSFII